MASIEKLLELNGIDKNQEKTDAEKIEELQEQNQMLIECIMEMAEILYA